MSTPVTPGNRTNMTLLKLPNGNWIDPKSVTAIRPLPTSSDELIGTHRARVVIHHGAHGIEIITANDDEHAVQIADEYAAAVNAAWVGAAGDVATPRSGACSQSDELSDGGRKP